MFGGGLGFIICLITSFCGATSWWWLLWGSLLGGFFEIAARMGCGEEFGDIIGSICDIVSSFGDIDIGGGDSGGGDFGGGDSGGGGDW